MPIATALTQGGTYILDDYTYVQVIAFNEGRVRYRKRGRHWAWRRSPRIVEGTMPADALRRRIRAEVDGGFFPDVVVKGAHRFRHSTSEISRLRGHLAERAAHRPFATLR